MRETQRDETGGIDGWLLLLCAPLIFLRASVLNECAARQWDRRRLAPPIAGCAGDLTRDGSARLVSTVMGRSSTIVRCKYCKRRFFSFLSECPNCQRRTPKGRLEAGIALVATAIAVIGIVWFVYFTMTRDFERRAVPPIRIEPRWRPSPSDDPKF